MQKNNLDLAPIALFTYNRPEHTLQTLKALSLNNYAEESILFIFCDGPKQDASTEVLQRIKKVRQVVRQKQWCKQVEIIEREENIGLANSIIRGVTKIVNKYGKIIVLEDDLVTAKGFLKFMNDGLWMYEEEEKVFGIAGHTYGEEKNLPSTYFLPLSTSWGWATWKKAWSCFNEDAASLLKEIELRKNEFDFGGFPYYDMLKRQHLGLIDSWAIRFYASVFVKRGLFLFPNTSLLKNIGIGNFSTHTQVGSSLLPTLDYKNGILDFEKRPAILVQKEVELIKQFFCKEHNKTESTKLSLLRKIKNKVVTLFKK